MADGNWPRFGLLYDFRNPDPWRIPFPELYRQLMEQIAWAESLGYGSVWLTEHHFCEDGYTPSPLVLAGAILERTGLFVGTNLMLLPLHNPIRLAEDAATLSVLSGGRFALGVGLGYRELEFKAFGRSLRNRPSLMEEGVEVIRRAWSGQPINFEGRRFSVPDVVVTPPVAEDPPMLLIGGLTEPACHRAARIGDGFLSTVDDTQALFLEGVRLAGRDPADAMIFSIQWIVVDQDPERAWSVVGPNAVYQLNEYISWGACGPPDQIPRFEDASAVLASGPYRIWDADQAVNELVALFRERPQIKDVHFFGRLPGESHEHSSQRIQFFAEKVIPAVRRELTSS